MARPRKAPTREVITPAPEVKTEAHTLIDAIHTHLRDCEIEYVYSSKSRQSKGRPVYARVKRLSPAERWLSSGRKSVTEGCIDFQIIIDRALWFNAAGAKQHAIIDHALSAIGYDDERQRFVIRAPDVEEYTGVVERNGLWTQPLRQFGEAAAKQLDFFTNNVKAENAANGRTPAPAVPV